MKAVDESGGYGMLIGPAATRRGARRVPRGSSRPSRANYIAQPTIALSRHPTFVRRRARRLPRRPAAVRPVRATTRAHRPRRAHARRAARGARSSSTRRRAAAARTPGCCGLMLSRVAESLYWIGALRRARRGHDAPARRPLPRPARRPGRATAGRPGCGSCTLLGRRGAVPRALRRVHGAGRHRVGALARRQPERGRRLHHARARERPLGARADLGRDVGGDQRAVPRSSAARIAARPFAARTRSSRSCGTATHLFQGSADATMTHGEPYEFIQLGLHLERAATTVRVVPSRYPVAVGARRGRPDARPRADRAAQVLQRVRGVRAPLRRVVRAARDRRGADPLARRSRGRPSTASRTCATAVDRIAAAGRHAPAGPRPALRRPRVRRGRRRLGSRGGRDAPRAARRDPPGG